MVTAFNGSSNCGCAGRCASGCLTKRLKLAPLRRSIVELRRRAQFGSINECARVPRRSLAAIR